MISHTETSMELSSSTSNVELVQWNASQSANAQHYAPQFPYAVLDESFLRHILNFTSVKGETMHSLYAHHNESFKESPNINDTFNYEVCSVTHDTESAWFSTEFQATLHFMYITILLIAIFGNGIVCFIVCTSSRMQTVTNYFIANLALSDMLMAIFCIPFSFISLFVLQWVVDAMMQPHEILLSINCRYWPFGAVLCKFVNYTQAISVLVSAYTLVAISIDRYIAIMFPLKPRLSKR